MMTIQKLRMGRMLLGMGHLRWMKNPGGKGVVTAYTALERRDAHRDGFAGLYNLLTLWYRWLRPDAEFLAFFASVAELLAIGSFIGLQPERGRDLAERVDDVLPLHVFWGTPQRSFTTAWTLAILTGLILYVGSPIAAQGYRKRGAKALEQGA